MFSPSFLRSALLSTTSSCALASSERAGAGPAPAALVNGVALSLQKAFAFFVSGPGPWVEYLGGNHLLPISCGGRGREPAPSCRAALPPPSLWTEGPTIPAQPKLPPSPPMSPVSQATRENLLCSLCWVQGRYKDTPNGLGHHPAQGVVGRVRRLRGTRVDLNSASSDAGLGTPK